MAHLVVCPHCKKGLRSSTPFAAGVTIMCPACKARFVNAGDVAAAPPAKSASVAIPVGKPAHVAGRQPLASLPVADPLDDDLQEVLPQQAHAAAGAQVGMPRRQRGLILALAGGVAMLAVLGVTAFVWPGFLVLGRPASQAHTLLGYIPGNSTMIAGAQIGLFRKEPKFQAKWNAIQQQIANLPQFPADARELLNDADEVLVGSGSDLQSAAVFVGSTERPFDPEKVKRLAQAGPAQLVMAQTIYPVNELIPGRTGFLALPADKILVLGFMPQDEFVTLLASAKQARLHADLKEQVEQARSGLVWIAARFDRAIQQKMKEANEDFGQQAAGLLPELPKLIGIIQRAKGALVSVDLGEQNLKLSVGVTCKDGADVGQCSTAMGGIWNQAKLLLGFAKGMAPWGKLVGEVQQSFAVNQRENTVLASVELNQDTLLELAEVVPNLNNIGGLPGVNPALPAVPKQGFPPKKK